MGLVIKANVLKVNKEKQENLPITTLLRKHIMSKI